MIFDEWRPLLHFFQWCDATMIGEFIRARTWVFPVIETIHILAMTVLFGSIILVDLRLMNIGMKKESVPLLAQALNPYLQSGICVMLVTGILLFLSEAMKAYSNSGFHFKIIMLGLALVFQYTLWPAVTRKDKVSAGAGWLTGILSLGLWFSVGVGGRAIGFV
jgi:hypothetical protein